MRSGRTNLAVYPNALRRKIRTIGADERLTQWQKYILTLYLVLPSIFLLATVLGFALSVYYEGWGNFKYGDRFIPAPYQPGDIIHHYK
jgi:hypothetical protein